mgnify:CR=1 FL=1
MEFAEKIVWLTTVVRVPDGVVLWSTPKQILF